MSREKERRSGRLCQAARGLSSALISYCMYKSKAASNAEDSSKFLSAAVSFLSAETRISIDRRGRGLAVHKVSRTHDRPWMEEEGED